MWRSDGPDVGRKTGFRHAPDGLAFSGGPAARDAPDLDAAVLDGWCRVALGACCRRLCVAARRGRLGDCCIRELSFVGTRLDHGFVAHLTAGPSAAGRGRLTPRLGLRCAATRRLQGLVRPCLICLGPERAAVTCEQLADD